jgi:hypothetical protein
MSLLEPLFYVMAAKQCFQWKMHEGNFCVPPPLVTEAILALNAEVSERKKRFLREKIRKGISPRIG